MNKERKIGTKYAVTDKLTVTAVEGNTCQGCVFRTGKNKVYCETFAGECMGEHRTDGKDIIFKKA